MDISSRKWWLTIPAALLVGAIGSGIWDIALKPFGRWSARVILDAVSFESQSLIDQIYYEAAKGMHEAASGFLLSFCLGFLLSLPVAYVLIVLLLRQRIKRLAEDFERESIVQTN